MNKVIDSMLAHRSIRSYTDRTVSDEDLNSIIRAVQAAPNWVNLQLVSIIAVKNTDHRRRLAELCRNQVHSSCSVLITIGWLLPAIRKRKRTMK